MWRLVRTEFCVMSRQGAFWLLSWLTAYAGTYTLLLLNVRFGTVIVCIVLISLHIFYVVNYLI